MEPDGSQTCTLWNSWPRTAPDLSPYALPARASPNRGAGPRAGPPREARAGGGEEFGEARVDRVMVENRQRPASEIKLALLNAVNSFKEKARLHDDLTLFIMKVDGGAAAETGDREGPR